VSKMTKAELLKTMLVSRRYAQLNKWDEAINFGYAAISEMEERRRVDIQKAKVGNVRIRPKGPGYEVTKGGIPKYASLRFEDAERVARELIARDGGQIVEARR